MMAQAKEKLFTAQIVAMAFLTGATAKLRTERGQASAEYVGVIIVAAIIVLALIGAATGWGSTIVAGISRRISEVAGK